MELEIPKEQQQQVMQLVRDAKAASEDCPMRKVEQRWAAASFYHPLLQSNYISNQIPFLLFLCKKRRHIALFCLERNFMHAIGEQGMSRYAFSMQKPSSPSFAFEKRVA
eukprot:1144303-Pelagomonas_calceolata.AAC.3